LFPGTGTTLTGGTNIRSDIFDKAVGDFDPLGSTNSPWRWGQQIFIKDGVRKELIRVRTCAPVMRGKLSLEYLAFLSFCRAKKQKVVQFVHLNSKDSNELIWIKLINLAQQNYPHLLYVVVLPFDNIDDIFSDSVSIDTFINKLLEKMNDSELFTFPEELKKDELLKKTTAYIACHYFEKDSKAIIDREGQRAFLGLFYAYLQEKIVFELDPLSESTIVLNHCADGMDRTGAAMGCILAADYHRLGKYQDPEFHSSFLGIVNGPAIAIAKQPILEKRIYEMMAVLSHLQNTKSITFLSSEVEWQLIEFKLDEEQT
jgi:hypothetical protein